MAETVGFPLLKVLLEKLGSTAYKKLARYAGIHSDMKKWEASLSEIRALLNDASRKELTDEYVRGWLNRLQHLAYDIDETHRVFELNQENLKLSSDKSLLEIKIVDLEKLLQSEKGQESENSELSKQITELQQTLSISNAEKADLLIKVTDLEESLSNERMIELSNQVNDFEKIVIIERSNFEKERRAFEAKIGELSLKISVFDEQKENKIFKEFSESTCYVNCCYDDDDSNSYDGMNVFDSLESCTDSCTNKNNVVDSELVKFEKMLQDERKVFEEERKVFEKERKSFGLKSEKLSKKIFDLERQIVSERKDFEKKKSVFENKKKGLKKKSLRVERDRCVEFVFEEETKDFEKERKSFEEKSVLFRKKIANLEVQLSDERSAFKRKEHLLKCEIKGFEQMIAELKNKTFEKSDFEEEKRVFEMEIRKLTRNLSELSSDIMKEQIMSSNLKKKLDETVEEKNLLSAMVKDLEDIVFKVNLNEPKSPDVIVQSPYVDYADSVCSFKTAPSSLHADVSSTKCFTPKNHIRTSNLFYDQQIDGSGKNHSKKGKFVWRVRGSTPNVDKPKLFVPKQNVQKNNVFKAKSFVKSDPIYSVNHMIRLSQKTICCSYCGTNKFVRKEKSESWYGIPTDSCVVSGFSHLNLTLQRFGLFYGIDGFSLEYKGEFWSNKEEMGEIVGCKIGLYPRSQAGAQSEDKGKVKSELESGTTHGRPMKMNRTYKTALPDGGGIVGRQGDKERLFNKLLGEETNNQNFNVVPIVGMGGVGKTTLARLLYSDPKVKDHFKTRAWVCVSNEFDILKISKSILENVTRENKEFADINLLQEALKQQLMGKRFLLVLDDVWSESDEDWDALVRPLHVGDPGSKIIITTRKDQLLKKLGHDDLYHLQILSFHEALSLFSQHALGVNNFDSHPMLRPHGEGIVGKCDGLPLALKVLGRLLRTKTNEEEWKELLNNEIWRLEKGDGIVPALRLSYNDLPAYLKQLFAYCSLFPKDYMFEKEELILLWMAEGFLHPSAENTSTIEHLGHKYFEELLSRSFFQRAPNDESLFLMHDLINDLAVYVAGDFFLRLATDTEKDVRNDALEKYRHMSFVCEEYIAYKKFKTLKGARNLRTFLATAIGVKESWGTFYFSSKILNDLLHELPLLKVLRLNSLEIYDVPESIGALKHLRYLNLSQTKIERLPENICNLYNLQTLIVFGCDRLTKLPKNFSKLKNLRHFDISDTPFLNKLPSGISELRGLQTLSKIFIGDNGFAITKLNNLTSLHGKVSLKGLDKVPNVMHALEGNLSQKRISELVLEWSDRFAGSQEEALQKDVLNVLTPHKDSLEKLGIEFYGGLEFPNWIGDPLFLRLTHVELRGCKKCTSIPLLGQLPSLKELFIQGIDRLKVVGSEILGTGLAFVSLKILRFQDMEGWELWSTNNGVVDVVFPCLQEPSIYNCPNLVEVSLSVLPSLRILKVKESGHGVLRSLVHVASSVIKLEIGSISGLTDELWGGVMEHLGAVEEVRIERRDEIRYLWESEAEACKVLVNIRTLEVHHCENLVSLGEKEEDNFGSGLISLKTLKVSLCNNMERCICPNSIETLIIYGCSITSVSFLSIGGGQKVKSLLIQECDKISENELGGGVTEKNEVLINSSMSMLNVVEITDWPNLKSVVELNCFIHLTRLCITYCPSLESFPDRELSNLTSLKYMEIVNCPRMDASFPGGFWPPRLFSLGIGMLKKPMSKWGPQHFPTSLVELWLFGGSSEEDDVSSFSQLSHLLPSSLTQLGICLFDKLESLSMGLQHLTSLKSLYVYRCPKVKDLPESLLDSLLYLDIFGCPNIRC
ncbi:hypothetical protein OSB04_011105 [Centaurea solstitialis]|uniref:Uncharacterized protein n=1 Tax=Centaurea solstitialis TaxID=347529 RepID=A0AA38WPU6_9ASTR|nr:hypothetical protein OSB04_011105 [Centaurea solstitialis]